MSPGPEATYVEQRFIDQLISMGWKLTTGNLDFPSVTGRESFREVLLLDDLRKALRRINLNQRGEEWLDEGRISQAVSALDRLGAVKLIEANQAATALLLKGVVVEGVLGWDGGRDRTIHYIDWDHPERNTFRVISQLRVDEPGGQVHQFIVPDLVLFVNGIPLVVVECKSPGIPDPIEQAIEQLQRFANRRDWVDRNEGNEKLFHTNQFTVATCFDQARVGTITARAVHFLEWKDTSPVSMVKVAASLGKTNLSSQEKLVAGMLRPEHLLDIVRHFVLFQEDQGKTIKIIARYQQLRAVQQAFHRLRTGKTRLQDGEYDRRGGIIWHTQGSGKSLAMVFLIRKMRSSLELRRFKIVVVTDRRDLEKQLSATAALTGETVKVAKRIAQLKELLSEKGPGLVFALIQKYQERDGDEPAIERAPASTTSLTTGQSLEDEDGIKDSRFDLGEFPVLNEDESILVMVDEAHRSHASALHANLLRALPNCARIGFTGTPILMGARKRTHEIFGDFIDRYTIRQSEEDGSTVPILYEGRTAGAAVAEGQSLDEVFEDMLRDRTPEEWAAIKRKYATKGNVMEATELIRAKARDMFRHYIQNILPNGFKAQLVAVSRRAAVGYREAFIEARAELLKELGGLNEGFALLNDDEFASLDQKTQFLVRAQRYREVIERLEFAPVISGAHNDDPAWAEWTDATRVDQRIARFKKPLFHDDPEQRDPLAFLIVKSMLLTGFDAPIEQVMYLDRHVQHHELLQAIARVNRTYPKKAAGIVVDYYGVARHLKEALAVYAQEDVDGVLRSLQDELPKLRDEHRLVLTVFLDRGITSIEDVEACVELLADEKIRADFGAKLKDFLTTLDLVLPRPEALPYVPDAKTLAFIQIRARNRYRQPGERPIGGEVGAKVRRLIDEHIVSLGINPKIPPISILATDFDRYVARQASKRAQAAEMEHALRYHLRQLIEEDPELGEKLSERLERILAELKENWAELVEALQQVITETRAGRREDESGLDPKTQVPFLGILRQEVAKGRKLQPDELRKLSEGTIDLVSHIRQEIQLVGFWSNAHAREMLRKWIVQELDDHNIVPFERLGIVADRIVELAKVNHHKLTR